MDKQAFKQRMRNLKSYRENNPGKGYWDWKVQTFEDGGEVGGKKEPPYPSFYNGRRVNPWTGQPIATGALKPAVDLEDFANLTPVGDVITVNEMGNAAAKKAGQSVQQHAHSVLNNPNASKLQKKRAQFAVNMKKLARKRKNKNK